MEQQDKEWIKGLDKRDNQINDDKIKICLLLQRSGKDFNKQQIKEIQTFLDCKGNYFEVIKNG